MPYVSARYAPEDPNMPPFPEGEKLVIATDDQGREWHLQENSEVGDWLRYREEGGTIDPVDPNAVAGANITGVPDDLVGGPTIKEVFNVHD